MASAVARATTQSAVLSAISNILAQLISCHLAGTPYRIDPVPLTHFVLYSLLSTPPNYLWQAWLESSFPGYTSASEPGTASSIMQHPVVKSATDTVTPALQSLSEKSGPALQSLSDKTGPALQSLGNKTGPALQSLGDKTAPALQSWNEKTAPALQSLSDRTAPAIQSFNETTGPALQSFTDKSATALQSLSDKTVAATGAFTSSDVVQTIKRRATDGIVSIRDSSVQAVNAGQSKTFSTATGQSIKTAVGCASEAPIAKDDGQVMGGGSAKRLNIWNTAVKFTLDQTVGAVVNNVLFIAGMNALRGNGLAKIASDVQADLLPLLFAGQKLWPLVSIISFTLVPLEHRTVFGGLIGIGWGIFLSMLAAKNGE